MSESIGDHFADCLKKEGIEIKNKTPWAEQTDEERRLSKHADPNVEKKGNPNLSQQSLF
jgi:hypothetical protein